MLECTYAPTYIAKDVRIKGISIKRVHKGRSVGGLTERKLELKRKNNTDHELE